MVSPSALCNSSLVKALPQTLSLPSANRSHPKTSSWLSLQRTKTWSTSCGMTGQTRLRIRSLNMTSNWLGNLPLRSWLMCAQTSLVKAVWLTWPLSLLRWLGCTFACVVTRVCHVDFKATAVSTSEVPTSKTALPSTAISWLQSLDRRSLSKTSRSARLFCAICKTSRSTSSLTLLSLKL